MENKKIIALFDFDGTITTTDIFFDFLYFLSKKPNLLVKMLIALPVLLLYFLKVYGNEKAKKKIFKLIFSNISVLDLNSLVESYYSNKFETKIRTTLFDKFNYHKQQNHIVVIVSANFDFILKPFAKKHIVHLICTETEIQNDILTGNFVTPNCYGKQKELRILQVFNNFSEFESFGYGDSIGDKEMLAICNHSELVK